MSRSWVLISIFGQPLDIVLLLQRRNRKYGVSGSLGLIIGTFQRASSSQKSEVSQSILSILYLSASQHPKFYGFLSLHLCDIFFFLVISLSLLLYGYSQMEQSFFVGLTGFLQSKSLQKSSQSLLLFYLLSYFSLSTFFYYFFSQINSCLLRCFSFYLFFSSYLILSRQYLYLFLYFYLDLDRDRDLLCLDLETSLPDDQSELSYLRFFSFSLFLSIYLALVSSSFFVSLSFSCLCFFLCLELFFNSSFFILEDIFLYSPIY